MIAMVSPVPIIQWYPGHIAKAQRLLREQLKLVDVVLEVRDARIPIASHNPRIQEWSEGRQHLCILNRIDLITPDLLRQWQRWLQEQQKGMIYCTNAQTGEGIPGLLKAAQKAGQQVNQRRRERGMLPRPVRAVVVGFPNVGKSALINRLLKRRIAASANKPGITRQLRWIRISDQIELLDTPGILPPLLENQDAALKLAICDDIGQASYDSILIATALLDLLRDLGILLTDRYGISLTDYADGDAYVRELAQQERFAKDLERTARHVLQDFRHGRLGKIALELPGF